MNRLDVFFFLFLVVFFLWFGLSAYVVLNRLLHDFRVRALCKAQTGLGASTALTRLSPERSRALHGILARLPRRVIYRITADVSQPQWVSQALSAQILSRWGLPRVLKEAAGQDGGSDRWRRISALSVLTRIHNPRIHELLRQALAEKDRNIAAAAVVLLGKLQDEKAAEILILALREEWYTPSRIATQLDNFATPVAKLLLPLLVDPQPHMRYWAVALLSRYRGFDYLAALLALLVGDPDASVRKAVAQTLGIIGGREAVSGALKLLDDPVDFVRANAARALGNLAQVKLAGSVTPLLADREWRVRLAAREALVDMGPAVRHDVTAQLTSPDDFARDGAAEVLMAIQSPRVRKQLTGAPQWNYRPLTRTSIGKTRRKVEGEVKDSLPRFGFDLSNSKFS
ncbi:MAG: HEAT repeat domain-containing protein [Burkholderiales bacterium]|nr:HEAT repeat domain-containing protein [Burkholderiales bacterium]